ncbi:MAG: flavodoxin family protein [Clostridia bacterium]|nr:flavodoxin family protein [Clostridia bacterium]
MKIVIIHGNPRKGNTYRSVEVIKEEMLRLGPVEFVEFTLHRDLPHFCNGCFSCFMNGENTCPHAKYVQPIVTAMLEADAFIMSSPVYALQLSAQLKSLLDHTAYCYIVHRPRFYSKKALVVSTTTGAGTGNVLKYVKQCLTFWGVNKVYTYGFALNSLDFEGMKPKKREKMLEKLHKTAQSFYRDIASGKMHSPVFVQATMFQVSRYLSTINAPDSLDRKYWEEKGWTSQKAVYFSPETKPNPFYRVMGRLVCFIFSRLF